MQATASDDRPIDHNDLFSSVIASYSNPSRGRVYSVMGPNGAGKSRLLRKLNTEFEDNEILHVLLPPNRNEREYNNELYLGFDPLTPPDFSALSQSVMAALTNAGLNARSERVYDGQSAAIRILHGLIRHCIQTDDANNRSYERAAATYLDNGERGEKPQRSARLVPDIEGRLKSIMGFDVMIVPWPSYNIQFARSDHVFNISELSDGEKRILLISIFLLISNAERFVFLVDEPELYLNEARAVEVWDRVEANFPQAVFVYATHSVGFATRPATAGSFLVRPDGAIEPVRKV